MHLLHQRGVFVTLLLFPQPWRGRIIHSLSRGEAEPLLQHSEAETALA